MFIYYSVEYLICNARVLVDHISARIRAASVPGSRYVSPLQLRRVSNIPLFTDVEFTIRESTTRRFSRDVIE